MLLKRSKLSTVILIIFIIFLVTTSYLLLILTDQEDKEESKVNFNHHHQYHKLIYEELTKLPKRYTEKNVYIKDELVDQFIENINNNQPKSHNLTKLWTIVNNEWITRTTVVDLKSPYLHQLYYAMGNAKIIKADIDRRGTQLKLLLTLEGGQQVIFKPKWYNLTKIINGPVYAGKDRYNGEILAFYLSVLLHKPLTPFSILRSISLINEIQPVATQLLLNTSYQTNNNNNKRMCIYGKCYYCTKNDPVCENYDDSNHKYVLNGALIFNIKANLKTYRSPWQRTYKNKQIALWQQRDYNYNTNQQNYCKSVSRKLNRRRLLDLIELSIFDFLIQNGDRHHYETLSDMVLWLDNGKSFGNPFRQHLDILAPLYQCCMLRTTMLENLERLRNGNLRRRLLLMPDIENLITNEHLDALNERLSIVFATIEFCKKYQSPK